VTFTTSVFNFQLESSYLGTTGCLFGLFNYSNELPPLSFYLIRGIWLFLELGCFIAVEVAISQLITNSSKYFYGLLFFGLAGAGLIAIGVSIWNIVSIINAGRHLSRQCYAQTRYVINFNLAFSTLSNYNS
jgi:hypothetical protein